MSNGNQKIRVLLTKSRLDGHDRGVRYVARKLTEAGMEVVYTRYGVPREIVNAAVDEDVDVVGISFSVGRIPPIAEMVIAGLRERGRDDVVLIVGGIVPDADVPELRAMGVGGAFGPGASADEIIGFVRREVADRRVGSKPEAERL